jgi:hypothetical protein
LDKLTPAVAALNQIRPEDLAGPSKVHKVVKGKKYPIRNDMPTDQDFRIFFLITPPEAKPYEMN